MKTFLQKFLIASVMLLLSSLSLAGIPTNDSIAPMLDKVLPAVVNVRAIVHGLQYAPSTPQEKEKKQRPSQDEDNNQMQNDKSLSVASGVIVDANRGYILTNAHVIDDAQNITVTLSDGRHFTARVIGADKPSDVALLQIKAKNLTQVEMADSNQVKVGDIVAAIGNPFGLNQTVTSGIVSALGRTTLGIESYENFIQTDAPINPGNSGGALINTHGQLIGINTAILAPDRGSIGIGFAIPANMAKSVMLQLLEYGDVKRGSLGISAQDISPELASAFNISTTKGAAITQVMLNSPAYKSGLHVGDIITGVNNNVIKNANDVVTAVAFLRVDSKVTLHLLRNNKALDINSVLADPQKRKMENAANDPFLFGVGLKEFTVLSPIHGDVKGILVVSVEQDSNAWNSDLRTGDVITSANQQKVETIEQLRKAAAQAKGTFLLNVLRGPGAVFLVINKEN